MAPNTVAGIVSQKSRHSLDETLGRLKQVLQAKGITIFAILDHSGEAERVGLKMLPTRVVVFGNPKAGTPLMVASPTTAIDLPLKILIAEDPEGGVWVSYNSATYLQERHGFLPELLANVAGVEAIAVAITE